MSFLSPRHHHRREGAPALGQDSAALDLLDNCWFFSNTLAINNTNNKLSKPPPLPRSPSTSKKSNKAQQEGSGTSRFHASRRLLRTPSLPSPRVRTMDMMSNKERDDEEQDQEKEEEPAALAAANQEQAEAEVDDDDLNWSSIYEGVLRTRIEGSRSALRRAPSMPPVQEQDAANTKSTPRLRHSHSTLAADTRHCRSHTPTKHQAQRTPKKTPAGTVQSFSASYQPVVLSRSNSAFQDKKWKSSSDLESIEVQGFKDLGFVFDKEELRENLAGVLPGLRGGNNGNHETCGEGVPRPYLSEAWHHPALVRVQSEARSAADIKDQLRMWAQAVACDVRQER